MSEKPFGIIYKTINLVNGKCYIGQTVQKNFIKYWLDHLKSAFRDKSTKKIFYNAIRKYGPENFMFEVLEFCDSKEELDEMEFHYIKQYKSFYLEENFCGYNMTWGGDGIVGFKLSKESIDKAKNTWILTGRNFKISTLKKEYWLNKERIFKKYKCITPEGNVVIIDNLNIFCKENNLSICTFSRTLNYSYQHKGYKLFNIDDEVIEQKILRKKRIKSTKETCERVSISLRRRGKEFIIKLPNNEIIKIWKLVDFCKENNLDYGKLYRTKNKKELEYEGYKILEKFDKIITRK